MFTTMFYAKRFNSFNFTLSFVVKFESEFVYIVLAAVSWVASIQGPHWDSKVDYFPINLLENFVENKMLISVNGLHVGRTCVVPLNAATVSVS